MRSVPTQLSIPKLRVQFDGKAIAPGDDQYDEMRATFYGGMNHRPSVIIRAANAIDVADVIAVARDSGHELSVRSGGHSLAGHGVSDGGIMLDVSGMRSLEIDAEDRTAWVEPGLTAGEYSVAAAAHGLATGFGDAGSVGIGGITVGGGIGFLARKHGLTIDALLEAEVVTADGQVLHADADTNTDLFWAIRGGGGNFGVVTRMRFRLFEVPTVVGGILFLPATPDVIASFVVEAEAAPEELSTIANVMVAPPMPFVPAEAHGKLMIMGMLCYAGDVEAGERAIAPFRALAEPIADMVRPMSYPEMYMEEEEDFHPITADRTMFVDSLERNEAETIIRHIEASTAMMSVAQIRVLGGAIACVPAGATAFAHRASRIMLTVAAVFEDASEVATHEAWTTDFAAAMQQGDTGAYVNFLKDEGEDRIRAAYPGKTWERLRTIKATYDPTNLFRKNQNIPPVESG